MRQTADKKETENRQTDSKQKLDIYHTDSETDSETERETHTYSKIETYRPKTD